LTIEAMTLRQLASAIDYLEALKGFDYQVGGNEIRIEWITGGACNGYDEMRKAIAAVVSARYQGLRLEAITEAENRVAALREELSGLGKLPSEKDA